MCCRRIDGGDRCLTELLRLDEHAAERVELEDELAHRCGAGGSVADRDDLRQARDDALETERRRLDACLQVALYCFEPFGGDSLLDVVARARDRRDDARLICEMA